MVNESETDVFIMHLLDEANITFTYQGAKTKNIQKALKTASKTGNGEKPGYPEFVCEDTGFLIVIEDKAEINKQAKYCDDEKTILDMSTKAIQDYAENGALHYAKHIIKKCPSINEIFAFGCSGNEKHHVIRPIYVTEDNYLLLDEVDNFENFNDNNLDRYYREIVCGEDPEDVIELGRLIKKSAELHEYLRKYGGLGDSEKPLVVSAILLALNEKENILDDLTGDSIRTDGDKIYEKMSDNLERSKVGEKKKEILNQFTLIKDRTKLNTINSGLNFYTSIKKKKPTRKSKTNNADDNDEKGETPLRFFTEFIKDEIFPSISTVKADVLGYFYSEFIKYSGGDGQTLGIVLTPKHITELFCDLLDIKPNDKIFDPCCGTGSFLIAGMNKMIEQANDEKTIQDIKQNNIHGIEIREDMFSIASTNMILRGDGKSNLKLDDFFDQDTNDLRKENYTIGLMNPPYSQGGKESEMHFIQHLLDSLAEGAKCAVIVPQSVMVGTNDEDKQIKKEIYKHHTIEGVISLNPDTFYRVGTIPCIAIFTAHQPHLENKRSKFINFEDDGYIIRKHVGLVKTERAIERKKHLIECWNDNEDADSSFMVKTKIKHDDEWLHSFYYFNDEIPTKEDFEQSIGDYLSFEFGMIMQDKDYLFK